MKRLGFKVEQIVTSYKSLSISLIDYAAPLLTSALVNIISALSRCHKRFLRIINCSLDAAVDKYDLFHQPSTSTSAVNRPSRESLMTNHIRPP